MKNPLPSQEELFKLLSYDEKTGFLYWKHREVAHHGWNGKYAGKRAFSSKESNGYYFGKINDVQFLAHRVIWKLLNGFDPVCIDHINGDITDNRPENLRNVAHADNMRNTKLNKRSTTGAMGVTFRKRDKKWTAQITHNKNHMYLGSFDTREEAIEARKKAELEVGFHQNHGRSK